MEDRPYTPARRSKFQEGTMNSTNSIHPPPSALWAELGIEDIINRANEESQIDPYKQAVNRTDPSEESKAALATASSSQFNQDLPSSPNIFERFSRAASSFFRGSGFSTLGKRKAGEKDAIRDNEKAAKKTAAERELAQIAEKENIKSTSAAPDNRKEEYERAYAEAKAKGLLPKPQVFVRPRATPRGTPRAAASARKDATATPNESPVPVSTLRPSTSKKDLAKQAKLSKRVSDLEHKLALARRQLSDAIGDGAPPVPPLPPTPNTGASSRSQFFGSQELSPQLDDAAATTPSGTTPSRPTTSSSSTGKIVKKRKASMDSSGEYRPITTESDHESDVSEKKQPKRARRRKSTQRLTKRRSVSNSATKENVVMVVPDGVAVPPIPSIPSGVEGKRATVKETDGFGGYGHEIF